ncbi:sigma 54-interacting transcriptional regulator [bacterium]|nr:sigma 54-interacting transcriptional regulator [bacterium]
MKDLLLKINTASRVEQFEIFTEIFTKCFEGRNKDIKSYFADFLDKWKEFLDFETKPNKLVRDIVSANFELFFRFIRASNNIEWFNEYLPVFSDNEKYLTGYFYLANIYDYFGYLMWLKHDIEKGVEYLSKSLEIANKYCKPNEIPGRYTNLGYLYEVVGDLDKAEYYYNEGLDFALRYNSINALKLAYNAMGRLCISRNLHDKAIDYFEDSLSLYEREQDIDRVAVINNLAMCYRTIDVTDKAKELYEKIDQEWIMQRDPELYFAVQTNLGNLLVTYKEYGKAEEKFKKSLDFAQKVNALDQVISLYVSLGDLYGKTDRVAEGLKILDQALDLSKQVKNHRILKSIYIKYADIDMSEKDYQNALLHLDKLIDIAKAGNNTQLHIITLKKQSYCYEKLGDFKKAYSCLALSDKMQEEVTEKEKKEKRKEELKLIGNSVRKHFLFQGSNSLISRELSAKIGVNLIGTDSVMQKVVSKALLASTNHEASILIRGESGTGKDIIARIIHFSSVRNNYPFIAVNSGSFSPGIVNSALFGHKKGAFTGAVSDYVGYFEAANKGTVFLDEIGEMPQDIQIALLRVLEEKKVTPLGSSKQVPVDFRLISATNREIEDEVKVGKLRLDFLNRINTLEINIPPLRERKDDIPILIDSFLEEISSRVKIKKPKLSIPALKILLDYDYPGNVRELKNIIEKLIIFNNKCEITPDDVYNLNLDIKQNNLSSPSSTIFHLETLEKQAICKAMKETDNKKTEAAMLLGITVYSLHRRISKYDLKF